jgi:hypothetical protein
MGVAAGTPKKIWSALIQLLYCNCAIFRLPVSGSNTLKPFKVPFVWMPRRFEVRLRFAE